MITIKNTENLTGVCISGDYNDLDKLVEAFHKITVDEFSEKNKLFIEISTRVLGLCYDVRHAYQGDREVELVDNGMDDDKMKFNSIITPKNNVYYKCNCFYPELIVVMLALNMLVNLRIRELAKSKYSYNVMLDKDVIWDDTIATIRCFQSEVAKCVKEVLAETTFKTWLKIMNEGNSNVANIAEQYIDMLNIIYIEMTKEKRLKSIFSITKRITGFNFDSEHNNIKEIVAEAAKEHGCSEGEIRLVGIDYPSEIEW